MQTQRDGNTIYEERGKDNLLEMETQSSLIHGRGMEGRDAVFTHPRCEEGGLVNTLKVLGSARRFL